jgi:hypothetical protein
MKSIVNTFEAPILFAFGRGLSWVYRRFGVAPPRQVIMWEMAVAIVEVLLVAYVFNYFFRHNVGPLLYVLPIMIGSRSISIIVDYLRLRQVPKLYDANAYRKACTEAQKHRNIGVFIRVTSWLLVGGACLLFASVSQTPFAIAGLVVVGYFVLYSSIFYVRAAEPPHPDEGDHFALPAGAAS